MSAKKLSCVKEVVWGFLGVRREVSAEGVEALEVAREGIDVSRARAIFGMDRVGPKWRADFWGEASETELNTKTQRTRRA